MTPKSDSSPHAWGTLIVGLHSIPAQRFIPTRVGNTSHQRSRHYGKTVHPHTRGEHIFCKTINISPAGSSPHAWGTHMVCLFRQKPRRFIPTRVGNILSMIRLPINSPVHPHTREEHVGSISNPDNANGSSPHAWGTHEKPFVDEQHSRFIPTRVGNTIMPGLLKWRLPVHPHTRGEHFFGHACSKS